MKLLSWDEGRYALGVATIDQTHRDFVDLASQLATADDARFPALFNALLDHTREHFAAEDARMRASRFAATGEHIGEHQRVLAELRGFNRSVQAGRMQMARAYVRQSLGEWFELHLATMDAALAAHLKQVESAA